MGGKKTLDRVTPNFHWPGVACDVQRYVQSCDICQRTILKGKNVKVPLGDMPIIGTAFEKVAIDLVGPLVMSDRKHRWILTMIDFATRYAIPITSIETVDVMEALVSIFAGVGIPREILSDRGNQFTSDLMKKSTRLLSIKQLTTTPYHAMCNGLVEKFNGTLKSMLTRMIHERPGYLDRYIPALMFAYLEVPQESLTFSPVELLYGRTVRGLMSILGELWTGEVTSDETRTTYQYVMELTERMEETCRLAQEELKKAKVTRRSITTAKRESTACQLATMCCCYYRQTTTSYSFNGNVHTTSYKMWL